MKRHVFSLITLAGLGLFSFGLWEIWQLWNMDREIAPASASPQTSKESAPSEAPPPEKESPEWVVYDRRPKRGQVFGKLIIPRIDAEFPLVEGTEEPQLRKGIGHAETSVLPGEPDTSVIGGHRETRLRQIGELEKGDSIYVETEAGRFTFRVTRSWIADKSYTVGSNGKGQAKLLLVTCYPFHYVGNAPKRYLVEAKLTRITPNS
ncbi:MAG: class D sortase [Planifilum fimeticola]